MSQFAGTGLACMRSERLVFLGLDFAVAAGGALVLTGPNGSGKSSLLRLMAGLIEPYKGRLSWNGDDMADDPGLRRRIVSCLGHQDAVKPVLTVSENVRFWAGLDGHEERVAAALDAMGLARLADSPSRFLSAGQRRRVALARVIASGRALWLLDEPTVGLDTRSVAALEAAIAAHRKAGGVVVAATHADIRLPGAVGLDLSEYSTHHSLADPEAL